MIQKIRTLIAVIVASLLLLITLGRVELNRTGRSTATDDSDARRPAAARRIDSDDHRGAGGR